MTGSVVRVTGRPAYGFNFNISNDKGTRKLRNSNKRFHWPKITFADDSLNLHFKEIRFKNNAVRVCWQIRTKDSGVSFCDEYFDV